MPRPLIRPPLLLLSALALVSLTGGCLARTVVDVATAPVRVAGKAVDLATTSQSEADEQRGRELRKREEELGKLQRQYDREQKKCTNGDRRYCERAQSTYAEMQVLARSLPPEPR